jgi:aromatic-L-amino-acid decarboxylase
MAPEEFRLNAHRLVDWMADYLGNIGSFPVKPDIKPGDIKKQLPLGAPEGAETFDAIFSDFKEIILPGMTHWQHPQFYAYFPSGSSEPSILGEMLATTLGAQCMIWLTSPSAEELEDRMMEWLRDAIGLPKNFTGVIQDSSSSSTLVALLTAREWKSGYAINQSGFTGKEKFRIYTSTQAHSSVDKDVRIAGFGIDNLVKIGTDNNFALDAAELEAAIVKDKANGFTPLCVVSTIGTTSSTAIDPIAAISDICTRHGLWHHIDASYAGSALILPELRWMSEGADRCDSFVFNPHKWLFTNFDCSAYFVRDKQALVNTFSIMPEYLKTPEDRLVNNYRDWGVPLGRRFRALKLWFVIRSYGVEGMRQRLRDHIAYGQWVKEQVESTPGFELMAPVPLNLVCFRLHPDGVNDDAKLDEINSTFIQQLNGSGKILLTQTRLNNKFVIRFVAGQTHATLDTVKKGWYLIRSAASALH